MAELSKFSDLPGGQTGTGQDNVEAPFRLRLTPTGIGDLCRAGVGSPRIGRPGDWNHADLHINASDPHLWQ
jgi:hypothetical protein